MNRLWISTPKNLKNCNFCSFESCYAQKPAGFESHHIPKSAAVPLSQFSPHAPSTKNWPVAHLKGMCQLASDRLAAEETKRQIIKRFLNLRADVGCSSVANSGGSPYHGILHGRVIRSLFAPEHRAIIQQAFNITDPNSVPVVCLAWKNRLPHSGQMLQRL